MAVNVTEVNGVDKIFLDSSRIVYNFPDALIDVNKNLDTVEIALKQGGVPPTKTAFDDLDNNYGTADAEGYADYLANNGFFFKAVDANAPATDVSIVSQSAGLALDSSLLSILQNIGFLSLEATQQQLLSELIELNVDKRPNKAIEGFNDVNCNNQNFDYITYVVRLTTGTASAKLLSLVNNAYINGNNDGRLRIWLNGTTTGTPTFLINPNGDGFDFAVGDGSLRHNNDGELKVSSFAERRTLSTAELYNLEITASDIVYLSFQSIGNCALYSSLNYKV